MEIKTTKIFGLAGSETLADGMAAHMALQRAPHEERNFEDGEHKARPLVSVRGCDVYVVHSLYGDNRESANDKLCRLLFFCGACRDAGAASVTAVTPYLCYSRKDRKTKARDPVTTRYVAQLFESLGINRVLTLEVHNLTAFQNAFRCATEHIDCNQLFLNRITELTPAGSFAVISPDAGGVKRAEVFRRMLAQRCNSEVTSVFIEKYRSRGEVTGDKIVGEVTGRTAIIIDDLIATGGTMLRAARAAAEKGATRVYAVASHGLFVNDANAVFSDPVFDRVLVSNSISTFRLTEPAAKNKLDVIDIAPLFGEVIRRLQTDGSLVELLGSQI